MSIIARNIPLELTGLRQWLIWRYIQKPDKPKPDKVPYSTMGYQASHGNPDHWSTFECALAAAARPGFADGVGFVFGETDPYCGIDVDDIWQSDADEGAPWALRILERFANTYSEVSPSGQGVKIWSKAKAPRCGKWPIEHGAVEIYDHLRFFTVTGRSAGIRVVTDHQADVEVLVANLDQGRYHSNAQTHAAPSVIPKGRRHKTLVSLAGSMFRRGMTLEAIEAALIVTDQKQCDPPYGPDHIRNKILVSAAKWR
jgi:primase-polymerase (primpol)-like protein